MTIDAVLRLMAASLEALTKVIEKATPEQIQDFLDRHNRRMDRCERALERLRFWDREESKEGKPA